MHRRSFIAALGALPIVGRFAPKAKAVTPDVPSIPRTALGRDHWQGSFIRSNTHTADVTYVRAYGTFQEARHQLWDAIRVAEKAGYKVSRVCLAPGHGSWRYDLP